jgi:hypothetical protein
MELIFSLLLRTNAPEGKNHPHTVTMVTSYDPIVIINGKPVAFHDDTASIFPSSSRSMSKNASADTDCLAKVKSLCYHSQNWCNLDPNLTSIIRFIANDSPPWGISRNLRFFRQACSPALARPVANQFFSVTRTKNGLKLTS